MNKDPRNRICVSGLSMVKQYDKKMHIQEDNDLREVNKWRAALKIKRGEADDEKEGISPK